MNEQPKFFIKSLNEEFFQEWRGSQYYLVETKGKIIFGDTKLVAQRMRFVSVVTNDDWRKIIKSVTGSLYLRGTQITALPKDLKVGGSLDLRGTQITALPEGLKNKVIK